MVALGLLMLEGQRGEPSDSIEGPRSKARESRAKGSGERRELLQRGPGFHPGCQRNVCILGL
jgi:hypothetical protein